MKRLLHISLKGYCVSCYALQGKLNEALADFNEAIRLCPWSVDPVLNQGVAYEAMNRFDDAASNYRAVIAAAPGDPSAWNNLGNATAGEQGLLFVASHIDTRKQVFTCLLSAGGYLDWNGIGPEHHFSSR